MSEQKKMEVEQAPSWVRTVWIFLVIILVLLGLIKLGMNKDKQGKIQKVQMSAKATQAQAVQVQTSSPTEPMVISLTAGVWSDWVELKVIPGAQRNYLGPEKTKIEFSDGTIYELDDPSDWGIKYPKFRLLSPATGKGEVITTLPS